MEKAKQIGNQIKTNKWIHYFILIIIGIILSLGLAKIQIRETHDGFLHFLRILGTYDTLELGQFPPLINQNYCNGSGYAMNLFYQPFVTYLPLFIKLFTNSYLTALKLFGALCIIASGLTMYHFTYQVTKNRIIALFAGFFYMIAPYKLANVYKRFAIGEFAAMVFIPFVFLGMYNLFQGDRKKHYYIAIGAIGIMLSHTVTTLYTAIFCVIYILFYITKLKEKEILKKCIINGIFILLVTALFWVPLVEAVSSAEYAIMDNDILGTNGNYASKNTISFYQLVKDSKEENGTTFLLGIPTIIAIVLTLFVYKKIDKKNREFYLILFLFSFICLFMVSRFFPWMIMPNLICKLQYPWRMLGFFNFFMSFICGMNLYLAIKSVTKKNWGKILIAFIFVAISVIYTANIMSQFYAKDKNLDKKYGNYVLMNKKISHKAINRDYMPTKAIRLQNSYVMERKDKTYVLEGQANILEEKKEDLTDILKIQSATSNTLLEFPYYYYVGYQITITTSQGEQQLKPIESEHGYLSCVLTENIEEATIKVEYVGTSITYVSYFVSAISFMIFILYIRIENKKGEKDEETKKDIS